MYSRGCHEQGRGIRVDVRGEVGRGIRPLVSGPGKGTKQQETGDEFAVLIEGIGSAVGHD
jgi:hypothetical protein